MSNNSSFGARLALLKPYYRRLLGAYLLLLLGSAFQLSYPKAIAYFIDQSIASPSTSWILASALVMTGVLLLHALAIALRHYLFASTGSRVVADLRSAFFRNVMSQEIGFFDNESVGELSNRLSTDVERLQELLTVDAAMLLQTAVIGCGAGVLLILISPQLSALIFLLAPLVVFSMRWIGRRARLLSKSRQEKLAYCGRLAQEVFSNIRLVHAFTQERKEQQKFSQATQAALNYSLSSDRLFAGLEGAATLIQSSALLLTVFIGGGLVAQNRMSLGDLTSFILYAGMASGSATTLGGLWGEWMRALGATDRVFELLQRRPLHAQGDKTPNLSADIRFERVSFNYPNRPEHSALVDFSLRIRAGEKIALVGESGAGKSTVVNLLLGFYPPTVGVVFYGEVPNTELSLSQLRQQIAIVEQEPALFAYSILENIRYGALNESISDELVLAAARDAHVDDFVSAFPAAYATTVGTRGLQLSGGQKQRVAIARALLRNPKLLILDEATSALDSESESKVQAALEKVMQGRTTIIIAHRLSTIAYADRVVVMRQGRILQIGTHQELIADVDGYYYQLVQRQTKHLTES